YRHSSPLLLDAGTQVKISLSRPEKDWKNKCIRDIMGSMIGFYLMAGAKPNRNSS
ncbi:unnamed protein product, partial [Sphacelaria rigidula]